MPAPTAWSGLTLCKYSDLDKKFKSLGVVLPDKGTGQSTLFNDAYAEAKGWIRKRLISDFRRRYKDAPSKWYSAAIARYKAKCQQQSYAEGAYSGCLSIDSGTWHESWSAEMGSPVLFTNNGVPNSSTQTSALVGDYLIDTSSRNGFLYINRGVAGTPSWSRFLVDDLINFIHNPTELDDVAMAGVLLSIAKRDARPDDIAAYEWTEIKTKISESCDDDYEKHLAIALSILIVDEDGDGIASNHELEQVDTKGFFLCR